MALLGDRFEGWVSTDFFMNEVAEPGVVVVYDLTATGVGASLDDANAKVKLPDNANGSGEKPAGILVGEVVNLDLTKFHLNVYKRQGQIGGKVGVLTDGEVTTNMIASGVVPSPGTDVYFTTDGLLHNTTTNSTKVGRWVSGKNSEGYAKVRISIV